MKSIHIYGNYPDSKQSLSVFMGQREDMGQSPGNLAAFLGFTNHYREFLTDFVKRTAGLNAIKSKKVLNGPKN